MLRKAENQIKIEGILSENDLKYGSYMKNGSPVEYIGGSIKVLVEQVINDENVVLEIPVHMFASKYTNKGTPNPSYESIEKVSKEFVSIAACGSKEEADKIRITNAELRMNEFYGQNGQLVCQPRVTASFVNRAIGNFVPQATFSMEFMVSAMNRVVDNSGVELDPPKLEITAIVPQYGERVDECKLYAVRPSVISAIESYWEPGQSFRASGRLNFSSSTCTYLQEVDFGDPIEKVKTVNVSEFIITGGSQSPLEGEFAFELEDIKKAMAERKVRLEEKKNSTVTSKKTPTPASMGTKGKLDLGF